MSGRAFMLKWVLPIALSAALGYWGVGPRFAGKLPLPDRLLPKPASAPVEEPVSEPTADPAPKENSSAAQPETSPAKPAPVAAAPDVSVGVRPAEDGDAPPAPRRRRRRRHHRAAAPPSDEAPPEPTTPADRSGPDPASTP